MNPLTIAAAIAVVGVVWSLIGRRTRRDADADADLGSVSTQWIVEHRTGRGQ
jgi:hypothetical protein